MRSLDVDSLFTNTPLEETIDIYTNKLFEITIRVESLSKIEFKELISLATKKSCFIFNGKMYKRVDEVAMGSPIGPNLANAFLVYFENNSLQNCPSNFNLHYCQRYVDGILFLLPHQNI